MLNVAMCAATAKSPVSKNPELNSFHCCIINVAFPVCISYHYITVNLEITMASVWRTLAVLPDQTAGCRSCPDVGRPESTGSACHQP